MQYGKMVSNSFKLAWEYKSLWIFGLFAGWTQSFYTGNIGDKIKYKLDPSDFGFHRGDLPRDLDTLYPILAAVGLVVVLLVIVYLIAHIISVPALIDGVNKITRGGRYEFGTSFSRGVDFFWRFLGIILLEIAAGIATVIVTILMVITIIGILVAIPFVFIAGYFWFTLFELAKRVIVARDCSIGDGLSEAYLLIKRRFSDTLIMALMVLGLGIMFWIAMVIVWLIFGVPLGAAVWAMTNSVGLALVLAVIVGLPISLVFAGYLGTFFTSLYTMFYFELVEPAPAVEPTAPPPPGPIT